MAFVGIRGCEQFLIVKAMAASGGSENATGLKFKSSNLTKPLPTYHYRVIQSSVYEMHLMKENLR